ncbi:hypothetical protein D3C77_797810 [compost metagenome]
MWLAQEFEGFLGAVRLTFFNKGVETRLVHTTLLGSEPEGVRQASSQHPLTGGMVQLQKGLVAQQ